MMITSLRRSAVLLATALLAAGSALAQPAAPAVKVDPDGTVHIPAVTVPFSSFASPQARKAFTDWVDVKAVWIAESTQSSNDLDKLAKSRKQLADYYEPFLQRAIAAYPVTISQQRIGGVAADVVVPAGGVAARNRERVLIELHSGGFFTGARILGKLEAVPIAGVGAIKVIAVDYRQGPEYKYPAATEDVVAVYRALLKTHKPENIGIFGCSAGGLLTAETVAWLQKEALPRPGAIGIFCAGGNGWRDGDSAYAALPLDSTMPPPRTPKQAVNDVQYFADADLRDPLVAPAWSLDTLAKFPPTLLVTGTRDMAMSSAIFTHSQLTKVDVPADLQIWDGMNHDFFADVTLPESKEAYRVIWKFFDTHLGQR